MAWPCQAFEHEPDHCEMDKGRGGCGVAFEVSHRSAVAADPGQAPFDDPSLREDDEALEIRAFDDLYLPASGAGRGFGHFRPLISGIGEDPLDEWKTPPRRGQQIAGAVAVLNVGGRNAHAEQKAERVDEDVTLAPGDFLARVMAPGVERGAPF